MKDLFKYQVESFLKELKSLYPSIDHVSFEYDSSRKEYYVSLCLKQVTKRSVSSSLYCPLEKDDQCFKQKIINALIELINAIKSEVDELVKYSERLDLEFSKTK